MKVGILLSGCGFYDGTEVAEAVLAALALEKACARPVHLSPEGPQLHTVDHLSGSEVEGEVRQMLLESARVARGRVRSLAEQFPGELSGLIIPGGQGSVKNLMTNFARLGERREVVGPVKTLLAALTQRKVPIGSISLGRTLVQAFLGEPLPEGDMQMPATEVEVDEARRLVFTPGFLTGASLPDVAAGIERLVREMVRMSAAGLNVVH